MGYVYKYIDKKDGIVKYVGIVYCEGRSLAQRIKEHTMDSWYETSEWNIYYLESGINTRTDAEYLEAHYIALYNTGKYFNKAKSGWGISNFVPDRETEWRLYIDPNDRDDSNKVPEEERFLSMWQSSETQKRMSELYNTYLIKNGRSNWGLQKKVNNLLSEKFFGHPADYREKNKIVLSLERNYFSFSVPAVNGDTFRFTYDTDGLFKGGRMGRLQTEDFISEARNYIESFSKEVDGLEAFFGYLKNETNFLNKDG